MERKNVTLDHNWVTIKVLSGELGVHHSTVNGWIRRNQIDYLVLQGEIMRRHLVDRRTAPPVRPPGKPKGFRLKQQPKNS